MTAPVLHSSIDTQTVPFLAPRSIEARLRHFCETYFNTSENTTLFKFVDALCGDAGAGSLKKSTFVQRLGARLDTIYFGDIDNIFGNIGFLVRMASESYPYNPQTDMLTSDQWDEVMVKDAWYRARIKDFLVACSLGGTPEGMRMMVMAALGVECDIFEVWRFADSYSITDAIGRSPVAGKPYRNEVVLKPYKNTLSDKEKHTALHMLDKIKPVSTITTVDIEGLAIHYPVTVNKCAASSTYFEVTKEITGSPDLAKLPPPEVLAQDVGITQAWLKPGVPVSAPTAAFGSTQEFSFYYLHNRTEWDQISVVSYEIESPDTPRRKEAIQPTTSEQQFTDWEPWLIADSPDNYPGGKNGITPFVPPALNANRTPYMFPYKSQQDFIADQSQTVLAAGGEVSDYGYRFPVRTRTVYTSWEPSNAIATKEPVKDSTVTSNWIDRDTL